MFKEIKEKLIKEYKSKSDYYNWCYNKAEILNKNANKSKLEKTAALSLCAFIPVFITAVSLLEGTTISSPFSMTLFCASITGASIGLGYIGQKLITLNAKRNMRTFTTAYNNRQIVKELADYEIEKVQTEKKLQIIDAILQKIESKEKILEEITRDGKYTITENSLSEEELNKNYELMLQNYNYKMEDLDVLMKQKYLKNKFANYRPNPFRIPSAIMDGFALALLISFPTCLGFFGDNLRTQQVIETMNDFLKALSNIFIPALIASPMTIFSSIRRSNDNLYAFNTLNNDLRENALSQKTDKKKEVTIEENIDKLTNELVELGYSIKETEYMIKEITSQKDNKEKTQSLDNNKERSWDEVLIPEEDIKIYAQESPAPFNPKTIFSEKKSGKTLVRKLTDTANRK